MSQILEKVYEKTTLLDIIDHLEGLQDSDYQELVARVKSVFNEMKSDIFKYVDEKRIIIDCKTADRRSYIILSLIDSELIIGNKQFKYNVEGYQEDDLQMIHPLDGDGSKRIVKRRRVSKNKDAIRMDTETYEYVFEDDSFTPVSSEDLETLTIFKNNQTRVLNFKKTYYEDQISQQRRR